MGVILFAQQLGRPCLAGTVSGLSTEPYNSKYVNNAYFGAWSR